jgi:hypothetical protein
LFIWIELLFVVLVLSLRRRARPIGGAGARKSVSGAHLGVPGSSDPVWHAGTEKERSEALGISAGLGPEPGAYRSLHQARSTMAVCSEVPFPRWRFMGAT